MQWQCSSVTNNYNYVNCYNSTTCACRDRQGFDNKATVDDKCSCPNGLIYYVDGLAYCSDITLFPRIETRSKKMLYALRYIFEEVASNQSLASMIALGQIDVNWLFNTSSIIRVDILGSFGGINEYLFGLFAFNPIISSKLTYYVIDSKAGLASFRADFNFAFFGSVLNASYVGSVSFDQNDKISVMDLSTLWFSRLDFVLGNPIFKSGIIAAYCTVYVDQCIPFGFIGYSNFTDCVNYQNQRPFGTFALVEDDSVVCGFFHRSLTPVNKVHCSHMEQNGGNNNPELAACSKKSFELYWNQPSFDVMKAAVKSVVPAS